MKLPLRTKAIYTEQAVVLLDANEIRLATAAYGSSMELALAKVADDANTHRHTTGAVIAALGKVGCRWEGEVQEGSL